MQEYGKTYIASSPTSFISRFADYFAVKKREEIFSKYFPKVSFAKLGGNRILDVGATTDDSLQSSNIFHRLIPDFFEINALSDQDLADKKGMPRVNRWIVGSATAIPAPDCSYEVVISNATLEHVGNFENQKKMIQECFRVARKYVLISTPNKRHPIEFHTRLPLLHLLPVNMWRKIIFTLGFRLLSLEENLNLLTKKQIEKALAESKLDHWSVEIGAIRLLGFRSHIIVLGEKQNSSCS